MSEYDKEPLSRVEEILDETSSGTEYDKEPLSRVEFRLKEVMAKIDGLVPDATVYKPAGSVTFANLPSPSKSTLGYVYDVSDAFTTTSDFNEGSGKKYPAGTNVAIVDIGTDENPIYKYDVLSGFIDMDNYVEKEAGKGLSSNDFTNEAKNKLDDLENYDDTEIKNDISDLSDAVEDKVDKVAGKGLSTNDFTDAAKNKLDDLENYDDTNIRNDISELESGKEDLGEEMTYDEYRKLVNPDPNKNYYISDMPVHETWLYGYDIDTTDENPDTRVSYPYDVDNARYEAAYMDFTTGRFNSGSWNLTPGRHFMPNPCMLKYDTTVDYYLDPDDYAYKIDGETLSDIANTSYGGNAMMEWNLIYVKRWETNGVYHFRCSNKKLDNDYECWSNYDRLNNVIPHFYTPIYFGSNIDGKLRSLSGQVNSVSKNATQEIELAAANGDDWYTEVNADYQLLCDLAVMLVKSTNTQAKYGNGVCGASAAIATGTMNDKGLFYGSNDNVTGSKIFGMENVYGNIWRRIAGYMLIDGVYTIKMTRGTKDGSTATDYNTTGSGYITIPNLSISGTSGSYIVAMESTPYGRYGKTLNGSATTNECDAEWYGSGTRYAIVGGGWYNGLKVGVFCAVLDNAASVANSSLGAALSCKPLAA